MVKVESRQKQGAGATKPEAKGTIISFSWWMKKQGYKESTIQKYSEILGIMVNRGADIFDSESVKECIAQQESWCVNRKHFVTYVYSTFLKFLGRGWDPPIYKSVRKLPFIPTEKEVDQLIAGCSRKVGTFLLLLKETGMRPGEAWFLTWIDIDTERRTVSVNAPEKGSNARILNISGALASRLELLPKNCEYVFRKTRSQALHNFTTNFIDRRRNVARKLNNPRLKKIGFKTLRHFKGTMLYHKTKDILHVQQTLGHKDIRNTLIYINLESAIFKLGSDEFTVRTAKTVEEAKKLVEVGFDYVTGYEGVKLFRKRK